MIRRAFTMRLKPDALAEYKHHHDNIWPELVAEIERSGIASITTFQRELDLFLVSEIADEAAWDKLWNSEVHKRWAEVMQPLMHLRDDGIVDAGELAEVFHLRTSDAGEPAPAEPADDLIAAILAEAAGESSETPSANGPAAFRAAGAAAAHKKVSPPRKKSAAKKMTAKKRPAKKAKHKPARPAAKKTAGRKRAAKKAARKKATKRAAKKKAKKR
jgi:L-rhamnose mutarotase